MDVTDTKPKVSKTCSKCCQVKKEDEFIKNRNICKVCRNKRSKELYNKVVPELPETLVMCNSCNQEKQPTSFVKQTKICNPIITIYAPVNITATSIIFSKSCTKDMNNIPYKTKSKHQKVIERQQLKEETVGKDNKKCGYCNEIKHTTKFRHNRLKCRTCERDEPLDKFKRSIRSRIYLSLTKDKKTIEYLGCTSDEYLKWILTNNSGFTLANRGSEWHIDHVIPLSKFNLLDDKEDQLLAFNWRNTMPLAAKENLSKNNKILQPQLEQHYKNLLEYHKQNNIEMPQKYIDLFARHLVAGSSLEPSLPLTDNGNICEELG